MANMPPVGVLAQPTNLEVAGSHFSWYPERSFECQTVVRISSGKALPRDDHKPHVYSIEIWKLDAKVDSPVAIRMRQECHYLVLYPRRNTGMPHTVKVGILGGTCSRFIP